MKLRLLLVILSSCLLGCSKTGHYGTDGYVTLSLETPTIQAAPESKAAVVGSDFPNSTEKYPIALWLMQKDSHTVPQTIEFANLKAELSMIGGSAQWSFYPYGPDSGSQPGLDIRYGQHLDLYAYYPYVSGAESMTEVPFVSGEDDWMIATKKSLDEDQTTNDNSVRLDFHHIMTCIEVRVNCKYDGSVRLTSMTLTDSRSRLVASGSFNCADGTIVPDAYTDKIKITPGRSLNGSNWISNYIIMPEVTDLKAEELTLSFVFNNIAAETSFTLPTVMKAGGVNTTIDRLARGYKYTYNLTLDNTLKFVPVGVGEWTKEEVKLPI